MIKKYFDKYNSLSIQVKASLWFLISAFFQRGVSAITTPIFARLMTTNEYGAFSVFSSWMSIVTCFVTLNIFGGIYSQCLVKYQEKRKEITSAYQGLLAVLVIIWLIIYMIFGEFFNSLLKIPYSQGYMMIALIWSSGIYQLWAQEQRVQFKYRLLVFITMLSSILTPITGIILINICKDKVLARIIGMVASGALCYGWIFIFHVNKGHRLYDRKIWIYTLKLSIPLIPHYLSQMVLNSSDRIMIKEMVSSSKAGIYSLAYSVSQLMTVFNSALLATIEPWIYNKIKCQEFDKLRKMAYPILILIAFANVVLIAFAPEIVRIFAPKEYYEAVWVIPPISMSVFYMFMYSFFALFEFYYEKTSYITIATFVGAGLNILLNLIFIELFGYMAAGYTTMICYVVYSCMHYIFMRKICNEKLGGELIYDSRILVLISLVFMILGFVIMITYKMIIIRYTIIIMGLIITFVKREKIASLLYDIKRMKGNGEAEI